MDLDDSPDVEKEFPGLYASEGTDGSKSKKTKDESDYSESEHDKVSKKELLIGRRKDKKDKTKRYATLAGESSPEEEIDAKSPSKSKKSKAFKFTSSKSKEKRSRDKEKSEKEGDDKTDKEKNVEKEKDRDHKKKDKDKKEKKDKIKDKDKEKDRKEKKDKNKQLYTEEVLELCSPVFGVSVSLATERSRCHDGIDLPLVVRDCIDYLQENLKNDQIYRVEPMKTRLLHFKRLYNNRERQPETDELDVPTACGLLKLFLKELPEPVLTTDLMAKFEEVASNPKVTKQQEDITLLLDQLPRCNKILLSWILLHFDSIIQYEKHNKMSAQSLAMLLSPSLQISHRLLITLLHYCSLPVFADIKLIKYVPPITTSSPNLLPDTPEEIRKELCKQESLLNQIHSEMNAGFVSRKREEQLWEVQRIITQLKRKLKTFERKQEKSVDDAEGAIDNTDGSSTNNNNKEPTAKFDDHPTKIFTNKISDSSKSPKNYETNKESVIKSQEYSKASEESIATSPLIVSTNNQDGLYFDADSGLLMISKSHPDYTSLIRMQLENQELLLWKSQLQARINTERAEFLRLKQLHQQTLNKMSSQQAVNPPLTTSDDYERILEHYMRENALLENKKQILATEIFEERKKCIALQVELSLQKY